MTQVNQVIKSEDRWLHAPAILGQEEDSTLASETTASWSQLFAIEAFVLVLRSVVPVAIVCVLRPPATVPPSTLRDRPLLDAWQADIEMAQAREAEESSRQAEQRRRQTEEDEDEEASDEVVLRARAMDDWKDEHPSGYGNSKLRPTA